MRYYMIGILRGEPHPVLKSERAKHNPLQRLAYLGIVSLLIAFRMATGFLCYCYNDWAGIGVGGLSLGTLAALHTIGAVAFLVFIIVHVYMTTTGHTVFFHISAM
ncbi:cytochrome b/b6 domain-containing protein, partial [Oceanidesulfovibrio marinus]|uniref:cytochrome b/b6 domain-containing protein n=1 Tax=Oceanidesulfovibrio marinus TaxID=370038 RepID=UPI0022A83A31